MREAERRKMEDIIGELKQRLEVLISTRQELELRCNKYAKEIEVSELC